jgi:hypothetical protein
MDELEDHETLEEIKETQEKAKETFNIKLNKKKLSRRDLDEMFS